MTILTGSWILDLWLLVSALVAGLYVFYKIKFRFWKKLGVVHTEPSFPLGDMAGANLTSTVGVVLKNVYDQFRGEKFVGMWMMFRPVLMIREPELVKSMFVKDFMAFHDRGIYVNEKDDPLAAHLVFIGGTKWRNTRAKLSPTFTSGKMKMMFPQLVDCSEELKNLLLEPGRRGEVVEMKEISARFTTDIISSCAFGIKTNSLKNPDAIFRRMGKRIFEPSVVQNTKAMISFFIPSLARAMKLIATQKDVSEFFLGAVKETIDYREEKQIKRNDFMQLLIQLKNRGRLDDVDDAKIGDSTNEKQAIRFTFEEVAAQAFVFFAAGFETSSTTMQFALYELAKDPQVQERTRQEIKKVLDKHEGQMSYEAVFDMDYLGRVIDETLRKYPPIPTLQRECNQDYRLPDTDVVIPSGTQIQVPILALQTDPLHFPEPEKFDPDRFTEEEKAKRHHYTYLPFGEGPRNCIGMRFGLMQTRVGLITLLSNFKFEVAKNTPIPLEFDPKSFILSPKGGMNLKVTAI